MRKRLISKTYLRNVKKYNLNIYFDNDDYYVSVKKIIETEEPFILPTGLCLIDNGYYIVEVIPKKENYAMRVFFNKRKERLEYYFDISSENGLEEETKIPYYSDLYLDVTIQNSDIKVWDEVELEEALDNNEISMEEFNLANRAKKMLLDSIKKKNNKYMKLDLESYLK